MARDITIYDDMIDSLDVIERIAELESEITPGEDSLRTDTLASLKALAAECADLTSEWENGEQLIRDSYFKTFAQELAEDTGAIDPNARWPLWHIDWAAAADELKMDYSSVDFDTVTYWVRSS